MQNCSMRLKRCVHQRSRVRIAHKSRPESSCEKSGNNSGTFVPKRAEMYECARITRAPRENARLFSNERERALRDCFHFCESAEAFVSARKLSRIGSDEFHSARFQCRDIC